MAHTHQDDLARHDRETHAPREAIDIHAPAEPIGNDRPRQRGADGKLMT